MTYETYRLIFLGAAALSLLMLIISVVLFFVLKIPKVIGDLTGTTARKAINEIRKQNERTGDKTFRSSPVNRERVKLTDKISKSGRLQKRAELPFGVGIVTEKLVDQTQTGSSETTVLANETTVLTNETTVLANETTVLANETTVLAQETSVLAGQMPVAYAAVPAAVYEPAQDWTEDAADPNFRVEFEITFLHTNEMIQ